MRYPIGYPKEMSVARSTSPLEAQAAPGLTGGRDPKGEVQKCPGRVPAESRQSPVRAEILHSVLKYGEVTHCLVNYSWLRNKRIGVGKTVRRLFRIPSLFGLGRLRLSNPLLFFCPEGSSPPPHNWARASWIFQYSNSTVTIQ